MADRAHQRVNRARWNAIADEYQEHNRSQIREQAFSGDVTWGLWAIPESQLHVLGDVSGKDVLEFGCGGAQWSTALARQGARPVGIDMSERQLAHARRLRQETGIAFPLVQASGEQLPFADASFDVVFADHGAFSFADPDRTIPEAARVLRPGGLLAFSHTSHIFEIASPDHAEHATDRLVHDYFDTLEVEADGMVHFSLPYSTWTSLFHANGLVVEELIEPRPEPDAVSTYRDDQDREWARRWPSESIWRVRKR
ncbi:MAG TPA: class I SAM-dependent methyltransferase [Actinomycetes bacterium]